MKPGKFLAVVENNAGDRKTYTEVSVQPTRLFQLDAHRAFISYPDLTFSFLVPLLGKPANSTFVQDHISKFMLNEIHWDNSSSRGNLRARIHPRDPARNESVFTLEEILAMVLRNAKQSVTRAAEEEVTSCVVAVPPQFATAERVALLDALKLARLNPLGLINENLAAAVKYAIDGIARANIRLANATGRNHSLVMYINLGASSLKISVVNHTEILIGGKKADSVQVIGEAWDDSMGSRLFDFQLAELVADKFNELPARKGKPDIRSNQKAMRRIIDKAEDIKERLSASKFFRLRMDNLADYVSINVPSSRKTSLCRPR